MCDRGQKVQNGTVAHFMPWSELGGVEIATLRLVDATKDEFHHIAFCLENARSLMREFNRLNIATVIYNPPDPSIRHFRRYHEESSIIAQKLHEANVDIVHFSDEKAAYHNSYAAFLAKSRMLCHIRSSNPCLSFRQKLCLRPVDEYVFVSKESKHSFSASLSDDAAHVIYDGIQIPDIDIYQSDMTVRHELNIAGDCILIGMVARVAPVKDYFTLAKAAATILDRHPNTIFVVVGDNSLVDHNRDHYAKVVEDLEELGIADKFIFTGHRSDLTRLVSAMDICVLSTHREGFPLSVLEAMAMGKPVVATSVGGIPEMIRHGQTGFLHSHENSTELSDSILYLIDNPVEARRVGHAAREYVRTNHSRQKFVDEITKVYMDMMRR
jgi:glycosyltransferase involved in cell wall biosynthesis